MLELDGLERSKHSAVLRVISSEIHQDRLIETEFSSIYGKAFESRNEGDNERTKFPGAGRRSAGHRKARSVFVSG